MQMPCRTLVAASALFAAHALAQVVTDGSAGPRATISGPRYTILDGLGTRVGTNVLHSFSVFDVRTGQVATFTGSEPTTNIVARITGGNASTIDGTLRVTHPGANLFLVNAAGLLFGAGASIDVPGAFHAATAHTLRLADGTVLEMRSASPVTLTSAAPAAFGFASAAAPIVFAGAQLRAREGRHLGVTGGDVRLEAAGARSALLSAPGGSVAIVATASAGEVAIEPTCLTPTGFPTMGALTVTGGSSILANEGTARAGAGSIQLRGGNITLDGATVAANTRFAAGRGIEIEATGRLRVNAADVLSLTTGAGDAGSLRLAAEDIVISGGSLVDTSCDPGCTTGRGGALTLSARRDIEITGADYARPTFVVSNAFGRGQTGAITVDAGGALRMSGSAFLQGVAIGGGDGNAITLRTGAIELSNGAQIDARTLAGGRGGNIVVENAGAIRLTGTGRDTVRNVTLPSGIFVGTEGAGNSGNLVISTRTLEVLSGAELNSNAQPGSAGAGGMITVNASESLRVAGTNAEGKPAGIAANTFGAGAAGEIHLNAPRIEIADRARVATQSESSGRANAIRIRGGTLRITGGGQVSSDARAGGDGGSIDIDMLERVEIVGAGSGVFATTYGSARGGSVVVRAPDITVDGGGIFAGTDGRTGPGGNVEVAAGRNLTLTGGGEISAEANSTGLAGSVTVSVGDTLSIDENAGITTEARSADGGDISVSVGRFAFLNGGRIATAVGSGQGGGGNIALAVPTLVLRGSVVSANAFGGPGGNIRIGTQTFFRSADSSVTASSRLGIDGIITLDSPALDPTGELLAPAPLFVDAGAVLAGQCGPRLAGRASSLVVVPRAAAGFYPDELLPAFALTGGGARGAASGASLTCTLP